MNAGLLSSALTTIFFFFLIVGFLFGLWRGFSKSMTRFLIVIVVAVASFFIVPSLSKTLLTLDISSWNINIGGVAVQNFNQFVIDSLTQIEQINELMQASPTFEQFILLLPQIILNIVLFVVFFMLVKMLSMIIYWIIAAIFFNKKKMADKNPHRFVGAIVGAVQGLLVAIIVLIPTFGLINLSQQAQAAMAEAEAEMEESSSTSEAPEPFASSTTGNLYEAIVTSEHEEEEPATSKIDKALETVNEYSNALNNNFVYKMLGSVGITKVTNSVFDSLTTAEVVKDGEKVAYKLSSEAVEISKIYPYANKILNSEIDITDNKFVDNMISLVKASYESSLLSDIITEIVNKAATVWTDESIPNRANRVFLGISAFDFDDDTLNGILDSQLNAIKNADKFELETKMVGIIQVLKVANDAKAISEKLNIDDISDLSTDNLESLFETVTSNETIKTIIEDEFLAPSNPDDENSPTKLETILTEKFSLNDDTAELVTNVVESVLDADPEELAQEVAATKELFVLATEIQNTTGSEKVDLDETQVDTLVDSLADSTIITTLIVEELDKAGSAIQNLDISANLTDETRAMIESKIGDIEDAETKAALEKIFGLAA